MSLLQVTKEAQKAIESFQLPEEIGFGKTLAPVMVQSIYKDEKWGKLELLPYGNISLDPTCKVFHYGQEIFEGMKAYRVGGKGPNLFRPEENWKRFNHSAKRMAIPEISKEIFMDAVMGMVAYCSEFIPTSSGESLYIRPFIFATEKHLGIKPSSEFYFMVVASPSGSYFAGNLPVLIERHTVRACPGGTGTAKTGGNYAASLQSALKAKKYDCLQTLWLDALERKYIEEMSGMNFMCVINDELVTPALTETILDGITRRSILHLAKIMGIKVREEKMNIEDLLKSIEKGECTECFACGTAAVITPIDSLNEENGKKYELTYPKGKVSLKLREKMLAIQEQREKGPEGWVVPVSPQVL